MFLIVGLGNIGKAYEDTPHNAGFKFVERFFDFYKFNSAVNVVNWQIKSSLDSEIAEIWIGNERKFLLAKPLTLMNRSGLAVSKLCKNFNINIQRDLILAHDDLDIKLGAYKIQRGKFPKGHKGIISVHAMLPTKDFLHVRIGVDNRAALGFDIDGDKYVLRKFNKDELTVLDEVIESAVSDLNKLIA